MTTASDSWIRMLHHELASRLGALAQDNGEQSKPEDWADSLMADAVAANASDIHISTQDACAVVRFRVDGALLDARKLPVEDGERLIRHFKVMADLDPTPLFEPAEARRTYHLDDQAIDLRISCTPTATGERMALRLLNPGNARRALTDLGLTEQQLAELRQWINTLGGMIVVAGPTGSGKTTTLYAMLHYFKTLDRSVITIEDPVEYQVDGIDQVQVDLKHNLDYRRGIRSALRQDPDIILLGELRDSESARAGVEASLSGHVVMTTLHARDAVGAVSVLRHWSIAPHDLATTLQVVIAQRLVRKLCPSCRSREEPRPDEVDWLVKQGLRAPTQIWRPRGCERCRGIGYLGRTGVFELWMLTDRDQQAIASGAGEVELRRDLRERGAPSVPTHGLQLVEAGQTSLAELGRMCSLFVPQSHQTKG